MVKDDKKDSKYYFDDDTQKHIIEFKNAKTYDKKNKIYQDHIHPAFEELVDNLVTVYNYKAYGEQIDHFKMDCISFLFETISKWDETKGTKAFSYFNVVAKNWMTIQSRRHYKNFKRNVDGSDQELLTKEEKETMTLYTEETPEDLLDDRPDMIEGMFTSLNILQEKIKSEKDNRCIEAIRHLYNNMDNIDFYNKRAIFVYLREISGLNSSELSCALSRIRKVYKTFVGPGKEIDFDNYKRPK